MIKKNLSIHNSIFLRVSHSINEDRDSHKKLFSVKLNESTSAFFCSSYTKFSLIVSPLLLCVIFGVGTQTFDKKNECYSLQLALFNPILSGLVALIYDNYNKGHTRL